MADWSQALWEIYGYPPSWPTPAGWTLNGTTGIISSTAFTPPLITLEAAATRWGKWLVRLTVNGGTKNGTPNHPDVINDAVGWQVLSPARGLFDVGVLERGQFDQIKWWVAAIAANFRLLDNPFVFGTVTPEQFGAKGDGVTNDNTAFTNALTALSGAGGGTMVLGGRTYVVTGFTLPANCALVGQGDSSTLKTTTNGTVVQLGGNNCLCRDFRILGNGSGASQNGISNGAYPGGPSYEKTRIINISCESIANAGVFAAGGGDALQHGMLVMGCRLANCVYGIWCLLEYSRLVGNEAIQCTEGIRIQGGNVVVSGGTVTLCTTAGIHIVGGGNDGHGMVSGVEINHNTVNVLADNTVANGMPFVGCNIYGTGTAITLTSSTGIRFVGCSIDVTDLYFDGSVGTHFQSCLWPLAFTNTFHNNFNAHASKTIFGYDNVTLDGLGPQLAYSYPADSNQTLTVAQSLKKTIVIAAGTITAGRNLTSLLDASIGQRVTVRNNTAQIVTWFWASGTGIAIPAGSAMDIGADGTNAIKLGAMT